MTREAAALVRQQLISLTSYLQELTSFVSVDMAEYLMRPGFRRASERMVQLAVECAIDTAEAIIEGLDKPPPATARAAFEELHGLGVLKQDTATSFARRYVGLSNRIVHDYEQIDSEKIREGALRLLDDAARYIREVSAWVDTRTPPS